MCTLYTVQCTLPIPAYTCIYYCQRLGVTCVSYCLRAGNESMFDQCGQVKCVPGHHTLVMQRVKRETVRDTSRETLRDSSRETLHDSSLCERLSG